ncbi:MAG: enoyl-CoA hydratase/isomerase family protein [Halioglobus sp.]
MNHFIRCQCSEDGLVTILTFSDPLRQNQLCWAAIDELADELQAARERGGRAVILTSSLDQHWFEHAWLEDLIAGLEGRDCTGIGDGWFRALAELSHEAVVSIAAINGDASGGGAELAWACDFRIAERQARFAQIEVNAGLTTGIGGCSRLSRLVGLTAATEMALLGDAFEAARLFELGALSRVVEKGLALTSSEELAQRVTSKPAAALQGLKRILRGAENLPLEQALAFEQETFQQVVAGEEALASMKQRQAQYDANQSIADVHGY